MPKRDIADARQCAVIFLSPRPAPVNDDKEVESNSNVKSLCLWVTIFYKYAYPCGHTRLMTRSYNDM